MVVKPSKSVRQLSPKNRRDMTDDSIIRGAAIIRDHISRLTDGCFDHQTWEKSETTGSTSASKESYLVSEDEENFSDPWAIKIPSLESHRPPRAVTPPGRQDDETFGFDSISSGNGTFTSSGRPVEWANRALSGDILVPLSARCRQPDTHSSANPLKPQTSMKLGLGTARMSSYNLVGPIVSTDDSDDKLGYSFVDDENEEDQDIDRPTDRSNYSGNRRKSSTKPSCRRTRILQLVTCKYDTNESSSSKLPQERFDKYKQTRLDMVVSPASVEYFMLMQDPAFRHAQKAGLLWQSLVGSQIRFPSSWWNGDRSLPLCLENNKKRPWKFFGRYQSFNPQLRRYVKHRSAPGRLLLHIVVQDLVTWKPVQDIVVGCFDPNARGIRQTVDVEGNEKCRELWLAVHKRCDTISVIDSLLAQGRSWRDSECKGPLGPDEKISNSNVRAVFGEEPPLETIFIHESTLYERLMIGKDKNPSSYLCHEFVFC